MGLAVWLPLTKDTHNQGYENVTVSANSNAQLVGEGKLGGCYYTNAANCISITSKPWMEMKPTNNFSFACWIKGALGSDTYVIACGAWELVVRTTLIRISAGPASLYRAQLNGTFDANTWRHVAFTWHGSDGKLTLYVDGTKVANAVTPSSYLQNISANINLTWTAGYYLNDFRLYDHCLSDKEVELISRGLVCHFPLNKPCETKHANLYSDDWLVIPSSITRTLLNNGHGYNYKINLTGNGSDTWLVLWKSAFPFTIGKTYLYSLEVRLNSIGNSSPNLRIRAARCSNDFATNTKLILSRDHIGKWIRYSVSCTIPSTLSGTGSTTIAPRLEIYSDNLNGNGITYSADFDIRNIQVVECDYDMPYHENSWRDGITYDTSGFQNNGTWNTLPEWSNESPRFNGSYLLNANKLAVSSNPFKDTGASVCSLAAWVKPSQYSTNGIVIQGGIYMEVNGSGKLTSYAYGKSNGYTYSNTTIPLNAWTHIAVVWTESQVLLYVNGQLDKSANCTGLFTNSYFSELNIGHNDDTYLYYGLMSDVRIYATALSQDQIRELYETSAIVTN